MIEQFHPLLMHKGSSQFRHHFVRLRRLHTVNQNRFGRLSGDNTVESVTRTSASCDWRLTHTHVDLLFMLTCQNQIGCVSRTVRVVTVSAVHVEVGKRSVLQRFAWITPGRWRCRDVGLALQPASGKHFIQL